MTTSTGRLGWTQIDRRWLADPGLSDSAMRFMLWLTSHGDEYLSAMNISRASDELHWGRNKIKNAIRVLEDLGLISTEQLPRNYGGTVTKFTLHLTEWSDGPQQTTAMVRDDARAVVCDDAPSYSTSTDEESTLSLSSSGASHPLAADPFDAFWLTYGNLAGTGKKKARECWDSAIKRGCDPEDIIDGLERWVLYWRTPGASKAMYAQGFLNQEKWTTPPPPIQDDNKGNRHRDQTKAFFARLNESPLAALPKQARGRTTE